MAKYQGAILLGVVIRGYTSVNINIIIAIVCISDQFYNICLSPRLVQYHVHMYTSCNILISEMSTLTLFVVMQALIILLMQEIVRILAEIVDVDENSISISSEEIIMSRRAILLLQQPLPPSSRQNYVQQSFFSSRFLNLTFQYRVICTAGSCGSNCTQTTNCPLPPPDCVPITCADSPCFNGGTCSNVSQHCHDM